MAGGVAPTASAEGEKINILKTKSEVKKKRERESSMSVLSQPAEVKIECTGWRW